MKVVHVLRKPCSEPTVAANVLRWGTGALNIDATRIGFVSEADEAESKTKNQHADFGSAPVTGNVTYGDYSMVPPKNYNPPSGGRWPANLVLQHLDGCVQEGTREVATARWRDTDTPHDPDSPTGNFGAGSVTGRHYGKDGKETVAAWVCISGCPVAALDAQSLAGGMHSAGAARDKLCVRNPHDASSYMRLGPVNMRRFGDDGGASRFFKQVKA